MKNPADQKLSSRDRLVAEAERLIGQDRDTCVVRVEKASGSTPRDEGAFMLVTGDGFSGTIGGGQLEWLCLERARELLASTEDRTLQTIPLGPEIGQCCGGKVELSFRRLDANALENLKSGAVDIVPEIQIHGAGHTGRALFETLSLLPFQVRLIDARAEIPGIAKNRFPVLKAGLPEAEVRSAEPGTAFVVLTHSHDLDFLISAEALAKGDAAYVGMIGSKTKRAVFGKWLKENGFDPDLAKRLVCPIGGDKVKDKRPEVIAALVAAELLEVFYG